jgi:oligoribonuclease
MRAIFLDIETTGLDATKHKPIDIALKIVDVVTGEEVGAYQSLIHHPPAVWEERDIASIRINGFTLEELESGKEPKQVAEEICQLFTVSGIARLKAVFVCQNPAFDRGFFTQLIDVYTQEKLNWPYHWLDFASMYWSLLAKKNAELNIPFPSEINLSKNAIAKKYGLPAEEEPHRAMRGVDHLILCYNAVVANGRSVIQ